MTASVQRAVLAWAPSGWRALPWRDTRDPWAVLVSELMLQQTQAVRVEPKWREFLGRWPTARACAAERPTDIVKAWAGLGYNRRALNLHRAATAVVERHDGQIPDTLESLLALPGIGPYTARAVLTFAFDRDVGIIDTNAARVLARAIAGRPLRRGEAQRLADALVPSGRSWEWNQAILDLGATVCTSRRPRCQVCPVAEHCSWRGVGPDPVVGSAGSSGRQAPFTGSDRQGRGRLLDALRRGPVTDVADACGWPDDAERSARIAGQLVDEGFAAERAGALELR